MDPWSDDESPKTEVPAIPVPDISDIIILIGSFRVRGSFSTSALKFCHWGFNKVGLQTTI